MELPRPLQLPAPIGRFFFRGIPDAMQAELLAPLPIREGTMLTGEVLERAFRP